MLGGVLAGGQSSRLGRPKWSEPLAGIPMALRAAAALAPHAREVVVLAPTGHTSALGLPVVADAAEGAGPLAGVVAALERARASGDPGCLLVACDLPLVEAGLVGALIDAWSGEDLVVPERAGRLQPLCALWSVSALPAAQAALASADRSLVGLARTLRVRVLDETGWRARTRGADPLLNVNTAADLARAAALIEEERSGISRCSPCP